MASPTLSSADYHRLTSYDRLRMTPHHLDWANQPRLDKAYPSLDRFPLDRQLSIPKINYMELVERSTGTTNRTDRSLDRHAIATLLHLTHAVTARSMQGSQPFYFRSVASAGALYPFEIYIAVHRVHGLSPGVYHYDLFNFSFNVLRQAPIPIIPPSASSIAATIYISGIFFRSAWKYRHRAYRYVLLDAGHLIENLRLALSALEFSFTMELDFDDDAAGVLLGLDGEREVCLAGIHIAGGQGDGKVGHAAVDLEPLPPDIQTASRVSSKETAYEQIAQAHRAGCERGNVSDRHGSSVNAVGRKPETWVALKDGLYRDPPGYEDVLWQRRSRRNFIPTAIGLDQWTGFWDLMAASATTPVSPWGAPTIGVLSGEGAPIPPGFYLFDPHGRRLGQLLSGDWIESMATACLDQMWLKNAAFHLLFITDPAALDQNRGARTYRHVMIEAGRLGQQAYLAATALGLGACGIGAIYDREAAALLTLPDTGALVYLVGVGPVKRR